MIYCNVEGIQWLDDVRIVIASDKAKKDQPFRCVEKEQRVHIFALPEGADEEPSANGEAMDVGDKAAGSLFQTI